jgi:diphthine-ammonia ligase
MIECGIDAVLVKAAVFGLNPRNVLGKSISELKEQLLMIGNPCGEGGEFETITLDSPLFKEEKIELKSYSIVGDRLDNEWDPCGNFQIETFDVVKKLSPAKEVSFQILRDLVIQKCIFLNNNHAQSHSIGSKMFPRFSIIPEGRKTFVFYHTTRSGISFSVAPEKCDSIQNMLNSWNISERGLVIKDALTIALYVPSMKEFGSLNKLYNEYFDVDPPSRCCVEIPSSFFYGDCVYISKFWTKTSLHVQSISSWAPACIGPYSQATQCFVSEKSKLSFLAGQIPLVPITMQIDAKSVEEELQLTLLHAGSILDALKSAYAQSCKSLKDLKFEEVLLSIIFSTVETFESVCSSMDELSETYNWPPSLVLSVTALPRNSRVETQILTNSLSESLGWRLESNHTEFCEFKICSESIRISNSGLSSSFYMPFNFGSCVSISLNEILDALIGSCNVDDDCAIVRLYYDCSVIEDVDAFECLVRNRMVGIAVSFFPCMGVYFKGCFTPVLVYCLRVPPRSDDADVIY